MNNYVTHQCMHRSTLGLVMLALVLLGSPRTAQAQSFREVQVGLRTPRERPARELRLRMLFPRDVKDSYWKEGGIVTALAGVVLANALPPTPTIGQRVAGSVIGALVFFWPGALIGKQFPKD